MIPIGRGQRELLIGDRQTGKSSVAIDAIMAANHLGTRTDLLDTKHLTAIPRLKANPMHVTALILLKGVLFARGSRLIADKALLGFRFP